MIVSKGFGMLIDLAVLIPCYNEEIAIPSVIKSFRDSLGSLVGYNVKIYVYDNNSSDNTFLVAKQSGAEVRRELMQGKGNVVRRMFRDIDADYYLMVDGDDTYDAEVAPAMVSLAHREQLDLVNCVRKEVGGEAYRGGHRLGNTVLTGVVRNIFGNRVSDMLSGYKVFSRRFVKSFPVLSVGFDIETELTIHALELAMPVGHVEGAYRGRPAGSESKLRTYRDGFKILALILKMVRHERPVLFFSTLATLLLLISLTFGIPVLSTYLATGLVPRFPTAILSMVLVVLAALAITTGLLLDTVTRGRREMRMLMYLNISNRAHLDR